VPSLWSEKERLPKPDLSGIERLRFLTTTDFPPFNYLDGGGRLSGFHVDLARAICAELAIADKCQIQAMPWAELEPALNAGEGEAILAGIAVTPESRERLSFSRPYLRLPARFVMRRAKATKAAPALDGRQVGVVAHSAHEGIARALFPKAVIMPFPQEEAMLAALRDGRLEAVFGDGMRLAAWLGRDGGECCGFSGGPYMLPQDLGVGLTVAVRHGDAQLSAAMDAALQQISAKGIFAELYLRYFPVSFY
jgi:polar amino acid transport system substrate-binding protein